MATGPGRRTAPDREQIARWTALATCGASHDRDGARTAWEPTVNPGAPARQAPVEVGVAGQPRLPGDRSNDLDTSLAGTMLLLSLLRSGVAW